MVLARSSSALPGAGGDDEPAGIPTPHATSEYLRPRSISTDRGCSAGGYRIGTAIDLSPSVAKRQTKGPICRHVR
jgi:hypothetical protein